MKKDKKGYVHIYTGNGKGKTTAAIGLAVRAAGFGLKVYFMQFAKGCNSSEHKALKRFTDFVKIRKCGQSGFIVGRPSIKDIECAHRGLDLATTAMSCGKYNLVIMDEAACAASIGLFSDDELINAVKKRKNRVEVIITGRNASKKLIRFADLVTEMKEIKHYWKKGVRARKGIEF